MAGRRSHSGRASHQMALVTRTLHLLLPPSAAPPDNSPLRLRIAAAGPVEEVTPEGDQTPGGDGLRLDVGVSPAYDTLAVDVANLSLTEPCERR